MLNLRGICIVHALMALLVVGDFARAEKPAVADQAATQDARKLLEGARRIVFLGDSITASGQYVAFFDAWLLTQDLPRRPIVIGAGLASETVSGLSEDGHADGRFPRPDLAERLARVLNVTKPDLVFACYGINCGIYEPFDEARFAKYQQGIKALKKQVEAAGAELVIVTPPYYDDQRAKKPFSYNGVLDRYSDWLVSQRAAGWRVIDLHSAMTKAVADRRASEPAFTFQPDAVHPNDDGHWFMAQQLIAWFGDNSSAVAASPEAMLAAQQIPAAALPLVRQRVNLLRDAHVSAAGHKRPGVAKGLPIAEAEGKAEEITRKIGELVGPKRQNASDK